MPGSSTISSPTTWRATTPSFTRASSASVQWVPGSAAPTISRRGRPASMPNASPYYDYRDEKIDVFGDTALVRSTNKRVGLKESVETTSMTTYTDIYVREGGTWKCIQAQITPVAPANYPPDETVVRSYMKGKAQP